MGHKLRCVQLINKKNTHKNEKWEKDQKPRWNQFQMIWIQCLSHAEAWFYLQAENKSSLSHSWQKGTKSNLTLITPCAETPNLRRLQCATDRWHTHPCQCRQHIWPEKSGVHCTSSLNETKNVPPTLRISMWVFFPAPDSSTPRSTTHHCVSHLWHIASRVQRIQLPDTCFRFLEETITFQFFCIICVMLLVLCTVGIQRWNLITPSWIVASCSKYEDASHNKLTTSVVSPTIMRDVSL